jgi:hypothetical protein
MPTQLELDQDQLKQELINKSEASYKALVVDPMASLTRLPEEVFVKEFLPYFSGKLPMPVEPPLLSIWIGIAGSPTSEVQIVDAKGNNIYTVPPMSDTETVDIAKGQNSHSMKQILTRYSMLKNVTPMRGKTYLDQALNVKADLLSGKSPVFEKNQQRWFDIFSRYDKSGDDNQVNKNDKGRLADDEFIYD